MNTAEEGRSQAKVSGRPPGPGGQRGPCSGERARSPRFLHGSLRRLLGLSGQTFVLPGHTSEPVAFDGQPIAASLSEVQESMSILGEDEEAFVQQITGPVSPAPENHERIVELNRSGRTPEGDLTQLESGANRCAVG